MAVGGAETIIFDEAVAARAEELPARLPVLFTLLAPYTALRPPPPRSGGPNGTSRSG
jgi:hypothetical protein